MPTQGVSATEATIRKALAPLCVLSGTLVVVGFFFPSFVGSVVSGRVWLVVSLLFFGSGLAYLSLLPFEEGTKSGVPYLLRLRHRPISETIRGFFARQDPVVFGVPVVVLSIFFAMQFLVPGVTGAAVGVAETLLLDEFDWLFVGAVFVSVLYCVFLLLGPWGEIRLGGPDAEPAYTYPTYFALFFTAGIAAGIVFWGPTEALFHYRTPPPFFDTEPRSGAAVVGALTYTLFHWGFSAWSAYLVVGLPIAYFAYQRGAPLRVSAILTPFLGVENLNGYWGRLVDVLAIFATIGGIATSIALVGQQFLAGVAFQWGVATTSMGPVVVVAGLTIIYVISAESGVERGIRRIAGINVALFVFFALLVALVGPRSFVVEQGATALGEYVTEFVPMSLYLGGNAVAGEWVSRWTTWNWSWWFSWAPFAGLFLAALSKGRRVRTVVLTGVVATSAATMAWFLLFGGTALFYQRSGTADILTAIAANGGSEAVAGFPLLTALPLGRLLVFLFLALIVVFIVTSADTSTLVLSILATKHDRAPTTGSIVFWGTLQGTVAVTVLLVDGGETLQALAVLTGGPFAVLSLVALVGLTMTFYRYERGHRSPFSRLRAAVHDRDIRGSGEVFREDD